MDTAVSEEAVEEPVAASSIPSPRASVLWHTSAVVLFAAAGIAAGVLSKAADESPGWLGDVTSQLAIWALAIALIGAFAPTLPAAAVRAAAALAGMCLGYYAYASLVLHFPVGRDALIWSVLAVTVTPAIAVLVCLARRADRAWSAVVFAVVAALCVSDDALTRIFLAISDQQSADFLATLRPVRAAVNVVSALAIVLFLPRSRRIRWIALALAVVLGACAPQIVDAARSVIGV